MLNRHRTIRLLICFVAAAMFAGLGLTVFAQDPSPTTIYACMNSVGSIRIVPAGTLCKRGETPLEWNQTGRVFDADNNAIGPLVSAGSVLTWINGTRYVVPVAPGGWVENTSYQYYFDGDCITPYLMYGTRAATEPPPDPLGARFFPSLSPIPMGPARSDRWAYAYGDTVVRGPDYTPGTPNMWRRMGLSGNCEPTEVGSSSSYVSYFHELVLIQLPEYRAPFTVR